MNIDAPRIDSPCREWLSDLWRVGFVMLLVLATRSWIIAHSEIISRDGIGFIRYALQLEEPPDSPTEPGTRMTRTDVLRQSFHPPGYSVSILAVSWPVRAFLGDTSDAMRRSAQIASMLASLLLVIPLYFLGKLVFDRQTAFVGTLLFQMLPVTTQVASDGLSDTLFLCFIMTATWLTALGLRRPHWAWFAAAGIMTGVTYLVRPEGLMLGVAAGMVLLWCRVRREISSAALIGRGSAMLVGLLIILVPYVCTIGRLTNKPTGAQLFQWLGGDKMKPSWIRQADVGPVRPDVNFPLADWFNDFGKGKQPDLVWATQAFGKELLKASFYVLPFFAMIGFGALWPSIRRDPAAMLIVVLGVCHSLLLWRMAKGAGYVAERHTLLIVACGSYFAAAAFPVLGERIAQIKRCGRLGSARFWSALLAVVVVASSVPAAIKPLHTSRGGHRAAGLWIAAQQEPHAWVLDPFSWAEFFAGHKRLPSRVNDSTRVVYIVTESNANLHPRLHMMQMARYIAERGKLVYHWPEAAPVDQGKVFVYRWEGADLPVLWERACFEQMQNSSSVP